MMENNGPPFDALASAYDAWFDGEGKLIFAIEARAFQEVLPLLPRPWLEVGVGSGRFAEALGIETGIDPSAGLLEMAGRRGVKGFLGRGEDRIFDEESFGSVFLCCGKAPGAGFIRRRKKQGTAFTGTRSSAATRR
jgi:SAM-dependent methyltransferase